ncbi:MAG: hypothetical protein QW688_00885 [Thermoprotei archaeon]
MSGSAGFRRQSPMPKGITSHCTPTLFRGVAQRARGVLSGRVSVLIGALPLLAWKRAGHTKPGSTPTVWRILHQTPHFPTPMEGWASTPVKGRVGRRIATHNYFMVKLFSTQRPTTM